MRNRADLTPVYAMIFRRLREVGADWVYHFPELHVVELARPDDDAEATKAIPFPARRLPKWLGNRTERNSSA